MSDAYLRSVLAKYSTQQHMQSIGPAFASLRGLLAGWAGNLVHEIIPSGSLAKGTSVSIGTDLDVFFCVSQACTDPLPDLYSKTKNFLTGKGYAVREQNVSLRVTCNGITCDIVPAKKHPGNTNDASLYRQKAKTWTKTNIHQHVQHISNSGRTEEIRILKTWVLLHGIPVSSFFLELAIIRGLSGNRFGDLSKNTADALTYLADHAPSIRVEDPSNSANLVSSDMTALEKLNLAAQARKALSGNWGGLVW